MIIKWQSDGKVQVNRKQNNMATIGAVVMETRRSIKVVVLYVQRIT